MPNRRYVCVGIGGVGGTICAKLTQSGADVVAVARGAHLRAIQENGLRLRTPVEDVKLKINVVSKLSELQPSIGANDVVMVGTKAHQALVVLAEIAELSEPGSEPAIVCW